MNNIIILTCLLLCGCTVGPDYVNPNLAAPESWITHEQFDDDPKPSAWWQNFNDPVITTLIDKAVQKNHDIAIAKTRLIESRSDYIQARAALLPSLGVSAGAERDRNIFPLLPTRKPYNVFLARFDALWEIDLFGGGRRQLEAATAGGQAAQENLKSVQLSIIAEVIRNYTDYRLYQQLIKLTQENITTQQETVSLTQKQYDAGQTARFDYLRANSQLRTTQAQLHVYNAALSQSQYRLEVLLGDRPGSLASLLMPSASIPMPPHDILTATPIQVLRERPDIQILERNLAAATALKGVAIANLFPKFSLSAFFGGSSLNSNTLFDKTDRTWQMAGAVRMPLFNFGSLMAQVDRTDAQIEEALLTYEKAVLTAFAEVESGLKAYVEETQRLGDINVAVKDAKEALTIAQKRYKEGLTSLLEVLDVERNLFSLQGQQVQVQANLANTYVALGKALGTGWQNFESQEQLKENN